MRFNRWYVRDESDMRQYSVHVEWQSGRCLDLEAGQQQSIETPLREDIAYQNGFFREYLEPFQDPQNMFYTWSGVPISYLQLLGQLLKQPERPKSWGERRQLQKPLQEQKIIDFEMGPSVKFVSPNKGLISKKKMGVNFFRVKNDQTGGGSETTLFHVFFLNLSLTSKV